jgi:hypothetical protein
MGGNESFETCQNHMCPPTLMQPIPSFIFPATVPETRGPLRLPLSRSCDLCIPLCEPLPCLLPPGFSVCLVLGSIGICTLALLIRDVCRVLTIQMRIRRHWNQIHQTKIPPMLGPISADRGSVLWRRLSTIIPSDMVELITPTKMAGTNFQTMNQN